MAFNWYKVGNPRIFSKLSFAKNDYLNEPRLLEIRLELRARKLALVKDGTVRFEVSPGGGTVWVRVNEKIVAGLHPFYEGFANRQILDAVFETVIATQGR